MNKTSPFTKSSVSVSALFILGNAVIVLPSKSADRYTFLEFLAVSVLCLIFSLILLPLSRKITNENSNIILKLMVLIPLCIGSVFIAADTFYDFGKFISNAVLVGIPTPIIFITFLLVVLYFGFKRQENILKFSLIILFFSVIAIIFFLFATLKNFEYRNIYIFKLPNYKDFFKGTLPYLYKILLPSLLLPFYSVFVFKDKKSGTFLGTALGLFLLSFCILTSVLTFSVNFASKLAYPYFSAVSTVSIGRIFTRMDGFSYILYFGSSIIKINVCIFSAFKSLKILREL